MANYIIIKTGVRLPLPCFEVWFGSYTVTAGLPIGSQTPDRTVAIEPSEARC